MYISLYDINRWFKNYDKWVHQAERAERLGLAWEQEDKILNKTHYTLTDLDLEAENMKKLYKEQTEKHKQELVNRREKYDKSNNPNT